MLRVVLFVVVELVRVPLAMVVELLRVLFEATVPAGSTRRI